VNRSLKFSGEEFEIFTSDFKFIAFQWCSNLNLVAVIGISNEFALVQLFIIKREKITKN